MSKRRVAWALVIVLVVAAGCLIYIVTSPGFAVTAVLVTTVVAIAVTGALALTLLYSSRSRRANEVGVALVSGVVFLLAATMTQAASDVNSFRNSVAFEQNLHGFDPGGRSLRGMNLGGKDPSVSDFSGIDLRRTRLRQADLTTADLSDADLTGADLFYAQLHEADLHGARFARADLRGAKLGTGLPANLVLASFTGATVSDDTCWRIPRKRDKLSLPDITPTQRGWDTIDFLVRAGLKPQHVGGSLGHVCLAREGEVPVQHPPKVLVYVCPTAPFLRTRAMMLAGPACSTH